MAVARLALPASLVVPHGTTVDVLVQRIRALIRDRGLGVGDPLPTERELGDYLSASRNTVREALRTLKTYGLIDVRPKVGAVIVDRGVAAAFDLLSANMDVSLETFADVQGFRRIVEVGIGDAVMTVGAADLDQLEELNATMRVARGIEAAAEADFHFHSALIGLANNRTLDEIYRFLKPAVLRLMLLGKSRRPVIDGTFQEHDGIVQAVRRRDRTAYAYLVSRHLEYGAQFISATDTVAEPIGD
ncbi:FadR/GntR family transcriptional regulator [Lichenihabitans psoromatis]|uniref:FadR/GntR family transcriptional regulator n=1 Tax=Lichenihabitans psoromatis TaxID=2528642 RepID=UPI0010359728|nr:FCD domain-containing protein [Lichenihabitans psoromatis]